MKNTLCFCLFAVWLVSCKKQITNHQPEVPARYSITIGIEPIDRPLTDEALEEIFHLLTKQAEDCDIAYQSIVKDVKMRQITFNVIGLMAETTGKRPGLQYFSDALSTTSSLEFWDIYQTRDENMRAAFLQLYEQYNLGIHMSIQFSDYGTLYDSPILAYVKPEDMPFLDSIFKLPEVIKLLPPDMVLAWSLEPIEIPRQKDSYVLYALKKTTAPGPFLTGKDIQSIDDTLKESHKTVSISLVFKPKAALKWADKTREAAADSYRAIGIVSNGKVISAPSVRTEISGGTVRIPGGFNKKESSARINKLKLGSLPYELKIVEAKKL